MHARPLKLKKNDRQPYYYVILRNADGSLVDVAGASIVCSMKHSTTGTLKINRQTTGITHVSAGVFCYKWQSGDTDTVGTYYIEFEIDSAAGKFTIPAADEDRALVIINDSLDSQ